MLLKNLIRTRIFKESKELRFEGGWSALLGVKYLRGVVESENGSRRGVSVLGRGVPGSFIGGWVECDCSYQRVGIRGRFLLTST